MILKNRKKKIIMFLVIAMGVLFAPFVSNEVNAEAPTSIVMGNPSWIGNTDRYKLSDLAISNVTDTIKTAVVSVNTGKILSVPNFVGQVNKDLNGRTYTLVFSGKQSVQQVETILKEIEFEYSPSQNVNIVLDGKTTNIPENAPITSATFNGKTHYYMYVKRNSMTWTEAYNLAKNYRYMGRQGYLVTITSSEEDRILDNITMSGAWAGGTRELYNNNLLKDIALIFDNSFSNTWVSHQVGVNSFYWACGPEAGKTFVTCGYSNWDPTNGEPNSTLDTTGEYEAFLQVHYAQASSTTYKWNDLAKKYTGAIVTGFFVEFGGYDEGQDPGLVATSQSEEAIVNASTQIKPYTITNSSVANRVTTTLPTNILPGKNLTFKVSPQNGWSVEQGNISIRVGDKTLAASDFTYDAQGNVTISADKITGAVSVDIKPTLDYYKDNGTNLKNYLNKTSVNVTEDKDLVKTLKDGWGNLTEDQQAYVAGEVKNNETVTTINTKLNAMSDAIRFKEAHETGINAITSVKPNTNLKAMTDARAAYNALSNEAKGYVGDLNQKIIDLEKANTFVQKYENVYSKGTVTKDDYTLLNQLATDYNALTVNQKKLIDEVYTDLTKKLAASKAQADNATIIDKPTVTKADKKAVEAALADYEKLSNDEKAKYNADVLKDLQDKLVAANAQDNHKAIINQESVTKEDKGSIDSALADYEKLSDEQKAKYDKDVLKNLQDKQAAANAQNTHKAIIDQATVTKEDKGAIDSALADYEKLSDEQKAKYDKDVLKNLQDKQAAANAQNTHKDIIDQESVTKEDKEAVEAALADYDELTNAQKAKYDKDVLKDLQDKLVAANAQDTHKAIIDQESVTKEDKEAVEAALADYEKLSNDEKAKYNADVLKDLQDKLVAANTQDAHATIIDKSTVTKEDKEAVEAALADYADLSEDEKSKYSADVLKDLQDKLVAANTQDAHAAIIDKETVTKEDKEAIDSALADYDELTDAQKAKYDADVLKNLRDKQAAANAQDTHKAIIDQATVTKEDKEAIASALADYEKLSDEQKAKYDADVLKDLQDKQAVANAQDAHATIIDQATVTAADKEAIDKALADYEKLPDEQKAKYDADVLKDLQDKQIAANTQKEVIDVIEKPTVTMKDLGDINKVLNLPNDQKSKVDPDVLKNLQDKLGAIIAQLVNKPIIDQETVTKEDKEAVDQALADYEALPKEKKDTYDKDVLKDLQDKQAAIQMQLENKEIIDKDIIVADDIKAIEKAINDYNDLTDDQKSKVDSDVIKNLEAKLKASQFLNKHNDIITKEKVSLADKEAINKAIKEYNDLTEEEKLFVDSSVIKDLIDKKEAVDFLDKYQSIINKKPVNQNDLKSINDALDAYNKLSKGAKKYIDASVLDKLNADKKIASQVDTSDNTHFFYAYGIIGSGLLGSYVFLKRKKESE